MIEYPMYEYLAQFSKMAMNDENMKSETNGGFKVNIPSVTTGSSTGSPDTID